MKRLLALLLAIILTFGFDCAAFAEEAQPQQKESGIVYTLLTNLMQLGNDALIAGSAGREDATAAFELLKLISLDDLAHLDLATIRDTAEMAFSVLKPDSRAEMMNRLRNVVSIINTAFINYSLVRNVFTSAGLDKQMQELVGKSNVALNWQIFRTGYELLAGKTSDDMLEGASRLVSSLISRQKEQRQAQREPQNSETTGGIDVLRDFSLYDAGYVLKNIVQLATQGKDE